MAATATETRAQPGFYCSTSGTYFTDKESLAEHYKSDFHKYNLKRKIAGLPPVTKEWFETRKAQLTTTATPTTAITKIWVDPLTKRKFYSENTFLTFQRSKKYQELVKASGQAAPAAEIVYRREQAAEPEQAREVTPAKSAGYTVVPPSGGLPSKREDANDAPASHESHQPAVEDESEGSEWETASEDELAQEENNQQDPEKWEAWDVCRSLFDNHISPSFQANLEYMFKNFGFYFPDADYLKDPEGLLQYLGAKLQYGKQPLYSSGDDASAKRFRSLHAVQRHMVDTNQCKMLFDDNEDEYADYYDYSTQEDPESQQLIAVDADVASSNYELVVPGNNGSTKVIGSRAFARYYKQRLRLPDSRSGVAVNQMLVQYRLLGIATQEQRDLEVRRSKIRQAREAHYKDLQMSMTTNILKKLPKNCPY